MDEGAGFSGGGVNRTRQRGAKAMEFTAEAAGGYRSPGERLAEQKAERRYPELAKAIQAGQEQKKQERVAAIRQKLKHSANEPRTGRAGTLSEIPLLSERLRRFRPRRDIPGLETYMNADARFSITLRAIRREYLRRRGNLGHDEPLWLQAIGVPSTAAY